MIEGVTVHPGVLVSSAEVGDDNKVSVKFNNGDEVSFTVGYGKAYWKSVAIRELPDAGAQSLRNYIIFCEVYHRNVVFIHTNCPDELLYMESFLCP